MRRLWDGQVSLQRLDHARGYAFGWKSADRMIRDHGEQDASVRLVHLERYQVDQFSIGYSRGYRDRLEGRECRWTMSEVVREEVIRKPNV